jgi:hypothetical protein
MPPSPQVGDFDAVRKYYYAGGCARSMFSLPTSEVIQKLEDSVASCNDIVPYIQGYIGDQTSQVINRLLARYKTAESPMTWIVSRFASVLFAFKMGPGVIAQLSQAIKQFSNPAIDGWILEMWFFAKLQCEALSLCGTSECESQSFPKVDVREFDASQILTSYILKASDSGIWLRPKQWNNGGYDAVYINTKEGQVCFIQLTLATKHSLKLEYFHKFLSHLTKLNPPFAFTVKTLKIIFVGQKDNIKDLTIQDVSGEGLLKSFGWSQGKEREKVLRMWIPDYKK